MPTKHLRSILDSLNTASALLDGAGTICEHSPMFAQWLADADAALVGASVWDIVPELVGYETAFAALGQAGKPSLRLDQINRTTADGATRYFSLVVMVAPERPEHTLLLATDTSEYGALLQAATQSRNELQLARQALARVNGQLDYVLQHYLPPEVAEALLSGALRPQLGGALREVSILFADVRGFTPLAERLPPDELMGVMNSYLTVVIDVLDTSGGTLVQIQGDAIMGIFNAPVAQPDHAQRAVQAACAMQRAVAVHQAEYAHAYPPLAFGIGVNTGVALVGNSGSPWRMVYTANGDSVNLAARITASAPAATIWVSESTAAQLEPTVSRRMLPAIMFKGKSQATNLFEIVWSERATAAT